MIFSAIPPVTGKRVLMSVDRESLLRLAREAAETAGELLRRDLARGPAAVRAKSGPDDLVTSTDIASEALITRLIRAVRPADAIVGEEGGSRAGRSATRWVIDPLDGTPNFLRGNPVFGVSIAAEVNGQPAVAVVRDPCREETFSAVAGGGAWCNGRRLTASCRQSLADALLGLGYRPGVGGDRPRQATVTAHLARHVLDLRMSGSAALDLCWVAAGRLDAYYESGTRLWDRAAGALIATEAGAWVGGADGGPPTDEAVLAAPPTLAAELRRLLHDAR